jgi:pyridoxamine 5'-phosphate oxidase
VTRLSGEVLALLTAWLPDDDDPDRPRLQLATVDESGRPDLRTLLLSAWDEDGFLLHTDATSRKAAQLAAHPAVALAVVWPGFPRQLVVRGQAEPADPESVEAAYRRRSPYLKQLAWQNTAEVARLPREERVRRWLAFQAEQDPAELPPPPTWIGYRVRPDRLTFWQSDLDGPSHRVEYTAGDGGWAVTHLPG